jgi:hydrogenase maturation protease
MTSADNQGGLQPSHRNSMDWSPPKRQAPQDESTPILVIGLGNPILGDDGVGWLVAEQVRLALDQKVLTEPEGTTVEIDSLALGGLSLMERLIGYDRVIIIDALTTRKRPNGSLYQVSLEELPDLSAGHTTAAHDTSLLTALNVGRSMGAHLPEQIMIIGVEAEMVYDFTEELTPEVETAIPEAVRMVINLLSEWFNQAS